MITTSSDLPPGLAPRTCLSNLPLELAPSDSPPPPYAMASARISNGWRTFFEVDISICHLQVSQSVET